MLAYWLGDARKQKSALSIHLLRALDSLPVSFDQIKSTGIGKVVKGFTKAGFPQDVQDLSGKIIDQWTQLVEVKNNASSTGSTPTTPTPPVSATITKPIQEGKSLNPSGEKAAKPSASDKSKPQQPSVPFDIFKNLSQVSFLF